MDTFRWILLLIGILVLVAIYLLGRRSERDARRRERDDDEYAPRFDDAVEDLHEPEPDVLGLSAVEPPAEEEADWLDNVRPFRPRAERASNTGTGGEDGRPRPIRADDSVVELRPRRESEGSNPPAASDLTGGEGWFESAVPGDRAATEDGDAVGEPSERSESPLERWMSDASRQAAPPVPSSADPEHEAPVGHDTPGESRARPFDGSNDDGWADDVRPVQRDSDATGGPALDPAGGETDQHEAPLSPPPTGLTTDSSIGREPSLFGDLPADGQPDEDNWSDDVRPMHPQEDGWVDDVRPVQHGSDARPEEPARDPVGGETDQHGAPLSPPPTGLTTDSSIGREPSLFGDSPADGQPDEDNWIDDVRPMHPEEDGWVDDVRPMQRDSDATRGTALDPAGGETDRQEPRLSPPPTGLTTDSSIGREPSLFGDSPADGEPDEDGWIDDVRPVSREVTAETEQERRTDGPREIPDRVASALEAAEEEARRRAEAPEMPDDVLIMHIVPADSAHGYFSGRDLRSAFEAFGLSYGAMDIFHREAGVGLPMFSVINRIKPGTFNPETMDEMQTPGFSLFMQMPGPDQPMVAFRAMCDCARRLAERLGGRLQDENGEPMTVQTFNRYEKRVRVFVSGLYRRFGSAGVEPEHTAPESPLSALREQAETQRPVPPASGDRSKRPEASAAPAGSPRLQPTPDIPAWAREIREGETAGPAASNIPRTDAARFPEPPAPQDAKTGGKQTGAARKQSDPHVSQDTRTVRADAPRQESDAKDSPPRDPLQVPPDTETAQRPRRERGSEQSNVSEATDRRRAAPSGRGVGGERAGVPVERDLFDDDESGEPRPGESASARAGAITRKLIERYEDRVRTFVSGLSRHEQDEDDAPDVLMDEMPRHELSRSRPAVAHDGGQTANNRRQSPPPATTEEAPERHVEAGGLVSSSEEDTAVRRDPPQRRSLVERAASMRKPKQASHEKVRVEPEPDMPEELLIIHLVADPSVGTFGGEHIAEAFEACGLTFGTMQIYHREAGTGKPMFSVVNMLKPGTFDPAHFQEMETPGISLFMQLPGPDQPMVAFRNMRDCARRLAESLGGRLEDETHSTMTMQTLSHYEERVRSFIQRQARHAGGRRG